MSWSTLHTIACDQCSWWDEKSQGATKAAATASAKAAGWLVEGKRQLCAWCKQLAETPVEPEPEPVVVEEPEPAPEPEPEPEPVVEPAAPATVALPVVRPVPHTRQLAAGGSRRPTA